MRLEGAQLHLPALRWKAGPATPALMTASRLSREDGVSWTQIATAPAWSTVQREREFFTDNLLVRIHLLGGPASHHGIVYSLFQVALHLPH